MARSPTSPWARAWAGASRLHTGFGAAWIDVENDGWLDLFVANGAVKKIESLARAGDPFPLHERNQLFRSVAPPRAAPAVPSSR